MISIRPLGLLLSLPFLFLLALAIFTPQSTSALSKAKDCSDIIYSSFFVEVKKPIKGTAYVRMASKIPSSPVNLNYQTDPNSTQCWSWAKPAATPDAWNAGRHYRQGTPSRFELMDPPNQLTSIRRL
jgi:hypothetical protein